MTNLEPTVIPPPRRDRVLRPHLHDLLSAGLGRQLTLISAPPGYGKTTVARDWVHTLSRPAAWLSLDHRDDEPTRFLQSITRAVQAALPAWATTRTGSPVDSTPAEASLLTVLHAQTAPFVLVLDDYHVIQAAPAHQFLIRLLEDQPPHLHLVVITRTDPPLPLARLRARNELLEVRASELRFSPAEAAHFLNGVLGLDLTHEHLAALETRTEGWMTALQLATLPLQGRQDSALTHDLVGSDRYVLDYLVEEILNRQPDELRQFLLRTSVLDRLNAPLCDAVTGAGSQAHLDRLERHNLLQAVGSEYRYHPLFAKALRAQLKAEQAEAVAALHRRASAWFESHGQPAQAISHALAARDDARAADLMERSIPELRRTVQDRTLLPWLEALPEALLRARPVLCVQYAKALMQAGRWNEVERPLRTAEQALALPPPRSPPSPHTDRDAEFQRLPAVIAAYRAALALNLGTVGAADQHATQVLTLSPDGDDLARGAAAGLLALTAWHRGDLGAAARQWAECQTHLLRAGHLADAVGAALAQGDIFTARGELRQAQRTYEAALRSGLPLRGTADLYVALSGVFHQRRDLKAARDALRSSEQLGAPYGRTPFMARWHVAHCDLLLATGDPHAALARLGQAARHDQPGDFPDVRPLAAATARVHLTLGDLTAAHDWQRHSGVSLRDDLSYLREYEHVTLARVLRRASEHPTDAPRLELLAFLRRLERAASDGGRTGSLIEILILQALTYRSADQRAEAATAVARALDLAEPDGHVSVFLDEGVEMAALLQQALTRGVTPSYVRHLLSGFQPGARPHARPGQVNPLSERERTVLRWLATDLSGPGIARELGVSIHTLRTHSQRIYDKLDVSGRRAAVRRAQELGLL